MKKFFRASGLVLSSIVFTTVVCLIVLSAQYNEKQLQTTSEDASQFVHVGREALRTLALKYSDRLATLIEKQFVQSESELSQVVHFEGAALVSSADGVWKMAWSRFKNSELTPELLQDQMGQWPMEGVAAAETRWIPVHLPQGKTLLAFIINIKSGSTNEQRVIGILPQSAFSDLVTSFKAKSERLFIVDGAGFSYAYPEPQYVGAAFESHTLVQHIIKNAAISFSGLFKDFGGQAVIGAYARVPDTNLFISYTKPYLSSNDFLKYFYLHSLLAIFGCSLIFVFLAYWLREKEMKSIEVLKENLNLEKKRNSEFPLELAIQNKVTDSQFNKAIIQLFHRPIVACVGFTQMLVSEVKSSQAQDRIKKIDNELRQMKDILQDISMHEKIFETQMEILSVNEILDQLLMSLRKTIAISNIQLEENIKGNTSVKGHFNFVKESLRSLLLYSLVRLQSPVSSNLAGRTIKIDLENLAGLAKIKITTSGVQLSADESKNIFKPFRFVNQEYNFNGLELLLARSYIEQHNGHLQFEIIGSNSFSFSVHIPSVHKTQGAADYLPPRIVNAEGSKAGEDLLEVVKNKITSPAVEGFVDDNIPPKLTDVDLSISNSRRTANAKENFILEKVIPTKNIDSRNIEANATSSDTKTHALLPAKISDDTASDFSKVEFPIIESSINNKNKERKYSIENSVLGVFIRKPKVREED